MQITFDVDSNQDDVGVWEFCARRNCDFDEESRIS